MTAAAALRLRRLLHSAPPPTSYLRRSSLVSPHLCVSSPRFVESHTHVMDGIAGGLLIRCTSSSLTHKAAGGSFVRKFGAGVRFFSSAEAPPYIVLAMPALSPTMSQGNIAKWRKKEGEKIEVGDVICEIETDKATLEFESLEEGFLAKILAPEGSKDVAVGQSIAITVEELDDIHKIPDSILTATEAKEEKVETSTDLESKERSPKTTFRRISPAAKLLLSEFGLDASTIEASGPHGTLLKGDVLAAVKSGIGRPDKAPKSLQETMSTTSEKSQASLPTTPTSQLDKVEQHEDIPNSQIRKVIARRLFESKQNTPHSYFSSDVILDPLLAFRKELKEQHDVKVSVNDIVIKAVALALKSVPTANAYWDEEKGEAVLWDSVDISIAVATEKGLMTPIIRNADHKNLLAISSEVKELAEKARIGKLAPHQFQGGTFSISNLGMFPVDSFCAIINPPQAGMLVEVTKLWNLLLVMMEFRSQWL